MCFIQLIAVRKPGPKRLRSVDVQSGHRHFCKTSAIVHAHIRSPLQMVGHKFSSIAAIEWFDAPIAVSGKVQRGFGRGSRDLGTPTANLPGTLLEGVSLADRDGVYLGFGCVPKFGPKVVKMVANIGRNITYGDVEKRVLEAYLMSDHFDKEFYGEEMRLCIIGFMRPELKFDSLDELISHIRKDVEVSKAALDLPIAAKFQTHESLIVS